MEEVVETPVAPTIPPPTINNKPIEPDIELSDEEPEEEIVEPAPPLSKRYPVPPKLRPKQPQQQQLPLTKPAPPPSKTSFTSQFMDSFKAKLPYQNGEDFTTIASDAAAKGVWGLILIAGLVLKNSLQTAYLSTPRQPQNIPHNPNNPIPSTPRPNPANNVANGGKDFSSFGC